MEILYIVFQMRCWSSRHFRRFWKFKKNLSQTCSWKIITHPGYSIFTLPPGSQEIETINKDILHTSSSSPIYSPDTYLAPIFIKTKKCSLTFAEPIIFHAQILPSNDFSNHTSIITCQRLSLLRLCFIRFSSRKWGNCHFYVLIFGPLAKLLTFHGLKLK